MKVMAWRYREGAEVDRDEAGLARRQAQVDNPRLYLLRFFSSLDSGNA